MASDAVVITGTGTVSALGQGAREMFDSLCAGDSGIRPVSRFDVSGVPFTRGGEVRDVRPVERDGVPSHAAAFADLALREALDAAGLPDAGDVALVAATNFGCMELCEAWTESRERGREGFQPHRETLRLAAALGLGGPAATLSLSCSSGNSAVGYALDLVRWGYARAAVAVAYDALSRYAWGGLTTLRTMTRDAVRPFDKRRSGTLFGEGAGAVVLERAADARARGAEAVCEVGGYGLNNNAYHMTASEASGAGIARAMTAALDDAGAVPDDVDHYNAHGTATKQNDAAEAAAFADVFGARAAAIPVTALKAALGHAMGAAGLLETIAGALTIRNGRIPPTLNCETPDPELGIDLVRDGPLEADIRCLLSGSCGIGGGNCMVLLRRAGTE